jgi:hypothetical protein
LPLTPDAAWSSQAAGVFARCDSASGRGGKSGGTRIIYVFSGESLPVFVLAVFAKNEKADLSVAERNALAKVVTEMIENYRRQK